MTRGTGATAEADLPAHPPSTGGGDASAADGGGTTGGGSPRRRRWWILGLAIVLVAVAVAVAVAMLGDDGPEELSETPTPTSTPVPEDVAPRLDEEGDELASLLERGRDAELHAVYEATGEQEGMTIEVWRKDGLVRQDTHVETEAGSADTAGFLLEDGESVACVRRDGGEWTCSASVTEASPDGIFGSVLRQLGDQDVQAQDATIDGRDVRCFAFGATDGEGEMCVTTDGVPVRATVGPSTISLTELEPTVDGDVFEPPAEITGADG